MLSTNYTNLIFVLLIIKATSQSKWDHFVFSQQWPQSVCLYRNLTKQFNCKIPKDTNYWTVHGLWPSLNTSMGPSFCNKTKKFDPAQIEGIKDQLAVSWPNLFTDEDFNSFWKHEWEKHGTCALSMTVLNSELKYFTKGLELHSRFDFMKLLQAKGITPSDETTYQYEVYYKAVKDILGADAKLQCFYDKERKLQFVAEIEFCLLPSFEVIECPKKNSKKSSAPESPCINDDPLSLVKSPPGKRDGVIRMSSKRGNKPGANDVDLTVQGTSPVPCNPELEVMYPVIAKF